MDREQVEARLMALGNQLMEIRKRERDVKTHLRLAVTAASALGVTEVSISELAQVDRMTVRKWLGKL